MILLRILTSLFLTGAGVGAIVLFIVLVSTLIDFLNGYSYAKDYPKIKASMVEHLYYIAPDKWSLEDFYCTYEYFNGRQYSSQDRFGFTLPELIKYRKFVRKVNKELQRAFDRRKTEREDERMTELVALWQQDIDKYKKEHGIG